MNIFDIYNSLSDYSKQHPFAVFRTVWPDPFPVIITSVETNGKYGKAFGFPCERKPLKAHQLLDLVGWKASEHFLYSASWRKSFEIPNAGSSQWKRYTFINRNLSTKIINQIINDYYEHTNNQQNYN